MIRPQSKRKHANVDKSLSNVLEKLTEQEKAADKRFIELEERRMKLEEQIEERRQIREEIHADDVYAVYATDSAEP